MCRAQFKNIENASLIVFQINWIIDANKSAYSQIRERRNQVNDLSGFSNGEENFEDVTIFYVLSKFSSE